jgi:hypothetical protein
LGSHARKPKVLVRLDLLREGRVLAIDEVALVVVRGLARAREAAGVGAVAAEARRDDADVDVEDRIELALKPGGTLRRAGRPPAAPRPVGSMQAGFTRPFTRIGHGERQDLLLVGHRPRVVDGEHEVDLVDRALRQLLADDRGAARADRLHRALQAARGTRQAGHEHRA